MSIFLKSVSIMSALQYGINTLIQFFVYVTIKGLNSYIVFIFIFELNQWKAPKTKVAIVRGRGPFPQPQKARVICENVGPTQLTYECESLSENSTFVMRRGVIMMTCVLIHAATCSIMTSGNPQKLLRFLRLKWLLSLTS